MTVANQSNGQARDQLQQWGIFALMALLLIGIVLFVFLVLLPDVNRRSDYIEVLTSAKTELRAAQQAQLESPGKLQTQLTAANGRLNDVAGGFLNEAESIIIVNRLYTYAEDAGVDIVNLQATPPVVLATHSQRDYRFQVAGSMPSLLRFLGSIQEVELPGFIVNQVSIIPDPAPTVAENTHRLAMNVMVVSSPYSTRTVLGPDQSAEIYANVGDLPLAEVQRQVEMAWKARDWDQAIYLLGQVADLSPENRTAQIALYRAHVNAGYHALSERDDVAAQTDFETALTVQPDGHEAIAELQQIVKDNTLAYRVEDQLRQTLTQAKSNANWQEAIRLLRIIAAVDPEYGPVGEELTQAYINYGNQLALAGDTLRAEEQFQLAQYSTAGQVPVSSGAAITVTQPISISLAPQQVPVESAEQTSTQASDQSSVPPTPQVVAQAVLPTDTPIPTETPRPTDTPIPTLTPTHTPPPLPTATSTATATPVATATPMPTATSVNVATATPTVTSLPPVTTQAQASTATYVVQPGDTLYSIAQRHSTTVEALRAANGLTSNQIIVGQVLFIALPQSPPPSYIEHIVTPSDTLYSLAQRYGTSVEAIMQVNGLTSANIYVGQRVLIPTPLSRVPLLMPLAMTMAMAMALS